ncbi:MAG: methyltransferase domain-containing protein [Chroococcidiopsidaceae cyanobacterium CP_BM_RX_35]|nr:methyltransferase domain-containing protein [Chroococcidiopsidaceae cyanobacterium CP_BM_RX_35]
METRCYKRQISEEERFQTDYYSYFEQPENATRYTPSIYFLEEVFKQRPFSLLDLGCGNGALLKYSPARCDYLGIDHSEYAIKYCLDVYPKQKFITTNLFDFLPKLVAEQKKFDVVMLSGMILHAVDKETQQIKDEQEIIQLSLDKILNKDGYLVIIISFDYSAHPSRNLFVRAESLQKLVKEKLEIAKGKIVYENMSLQLGLEKKIREQKVKPEWFIPDSGTDDSNKYAGTYMASWTFIATSTSSGS